MLGVNSSFVIISRTTKASFLSSFVSSIGWNSLTLAGIHGRYVTFHKFTEASGYFGPFSVILFVISHIPGLLLLWACDIIYHIWPLPDIIPFQSHDSAVNHHTINWNLSTFPSYPPACYELLWKHFDTHFYPDIPLHLPHCIHALAQLRVLYLILNLVGLHHIGSVGRYSPPSFHYFSCLCSQVCNVVKSQSVIWNSALQKQICKIN